MRCTIGTTVVMTGLVVALLAFRPEVVDDPGVAQAQNRQNSGKNSEGGVAGKLPESQLETKSPTDDAQTRAKLTSTRMEGEFVEVPLNAALTYIADKVVVQFYIDQKSLTNSNVAPDSPVTLNLKDVPAEMVLDLVLRQQGLGYRLRNGVIMIASQEDIQSQVEVRVYPVPEDDAQELAALIPATIDTNNWREHTVTTGGGSHMRLPPGVGRMPGGYGPSSPEPTSTETIGGGGGAGTIRVYRGVLVVSQTPEVHQKIEKLLADLESALVDRPRGATPPAVGPHSGGPRGPGYPEGLPTHARRSDIDSRSGLPRGPGSPHPSGLPGATPPSADRPSESPRPSVPTLPAPSSPPSAGPRAPSTNGSPTVPNPRPTEPDPFSPAEDRPPTSAKQ